MLGPALFTPISFLIYPGCQTTCICRDLNKANDTAMQVATYWADAMKVHRQAKKGASLASQGKVDPTCV